MADPNRPVHVMRFGAWRFNWRAGRYPVVWDYNGRALSICLRWFYVSIGRAIPGEEEQ
jgi:hypothetical protein